MIGGFEGKTFALEHVQTRHHQQGLPIANGEIPGVELQDGHARSQSGTIAS
jgi:hypothetical protein